MSLDTLGERGGGIGSRENLLGDAFYPLYDRLFDDDSNFVADFERKLQQSQMGTPVELYLSQALAVGVLFGFFLWFLGTFIGYWVFAFGLVEVGPLLGARIPSGILLDLANAARIPFLIGATGLIFGSIGFATGFGLLVMLPYTRASSRRREINMLLSDAVSFMYALSVGGLNQLEIIESVAQAEDTYGEVSREFQSILYETEYFDTDYRTAIRQQALLTPSEELSQFLTDMLSIINSGGDLESFLDDKKDKHMRTAQHEQEQTLESLELFGEMYMTLSLFPLLLIVVLVVMLMMGEVPMSVMYVTVYALIPLIGVAFLILVSTVKKDDPGDGYLDVQPGSVDLTEQQQGILDLGLTDRFAESTDFNIFSRIRSKEGTKATIDLLKRPHHFFLQQPMYTLLISLPAAIVVLAIAIYSGSAPASWSEMVDQPVWGTFVWLYLPLYLVLVPLGVFVEWDRRRRYGITDHLSEELRKLSSANDTGMTLLESFRTVAETSAGKLSTEFHEIHSKVSYGMTLREALIQFNNKYHIPRMARTVKLVAKAQEASSEITDVLTTAAKTSENHDEIERERQARTRMQITIIIMTFLTMLAVMAILKVQFLDVMGALGSEADIDDAPAVGGMGFGGGIDVDTLNVLFFHGVTLHAIMSGFIAGYMRDADLRSGIKYAVVLMTVALTVWMFVG